MGVLSSHACHRATVRVKQVAGGRRSRRGPMGWVETGGDRRRPAETGGDQPGPAGTSRDAGDEVIIGVIT